MASRKCDLSLQFHMELVWSLTRFLFSIRVVFDDFDPWPEQILYVGQSPPSQLGCYYLPLGVVRFQFWIHFLFCCLLPLFCGGSVNFYSYLLYFSYLILGSMFMPLHSASFCTLFSFSPGHCSLTGLIPYFFSDILLVQILLFPSGKISLFLISDFVMITRTLQIGLISIASILHPIIASVLGLFSRM